MPEGEQPRERLRRLAFEQKYRFAEALREESVRQDWRLLSEPTARAIADYLEAELEYGLTPHSVRGLAERRGMGEAEQTRHRRVISGGGGGPYKWPARLYLSGWAVKSVGSRRVVGLLVQHDRFREGGALRQRHLHLVGQGAPVATGPEPALPEALASTPMYQFVDLQFVLDDGDVIPFGCRAIGPDEGGAPTSAAMNLVEHAREELRAAPGQLTGPAGTDLPPVICAASTLAEGLQQLLAEQEIDCVGLVPASWDHQFFVNGARVRQYAPLAQQLAGAHSPLRLYSRHPHAQEIPLFAFVGEGPDGPCPWFVRPFPRTPRDTHRRGGLDHRRACELAQHVRQRQPDSSTTRLGAHALRFPRNDGLERHYTVFALFELFLKQEGETP
jgi:hypothetical protein